MAFDKTARDGLRDAQNGKITKKLDPQFPGAVTDADRVARPDGSTVEAGLVAGAAATTKVGNSLGGFRSWLGTAAIAPILTAVGPDGNRRMSFGWNRAAGNFVLGALIKGARFDASVAATPTAQALRGRNYTGAGSVPLLSVNRRIALSFNRLSGEPLWMGKPWPVPSQGPMPQAARAMREYSGTGPYQPLVAVGRRAALSIYLPTGEPAWGSRPWPIPINSPIRALGRTLREYSGSSRVPVVTVGRRELISYDRDTLAPLWMGNAWPGGGGGGGTGGFPFILIAASNAPDRVKNVADVICNGVNDDIKIQAAIDALPDGGTVLDGGAGVITGGKRGWLFFSEGWFAISNKVVVPPGSTIRVTGCGCSPWIPIGKRVDRYTGGTIIYSTDPNGDIWHFPKATYPHPTTGVITSQPATGITVSDIEFRVFNTPAKTEGVALNLDGWITGVINNINVLGDREVNLNPKIARGISIQAGGSSSRKELRAVNVYNFRKLGIDINTTHLMGDGLSTGNISGDAFSAGFAISPTDDCKFGGLQAFGAKYGVTIRASPALQFEIDTLHCEAIDYPALIDSSCPVRVRTLNVDHLVLYRGDIVTKATVDFLVAKDNPTKRAQNRLAIVIPAGATSASLAHDLIAAPRSRHATPRNNPGGPYWLDADATTATINLAASSATDVTFDVEVKI